MDRRTRYGDSDRDLFAVINLLGLWPLRPSALAGITTAPGSLPLGARLAHRRYDLRPRKLTSTQEDEIRSFAGSRCLRSRGGLRVLSRND